MAYTHDDKTPGQLIRSADWNAMGNEVVRLEGDKVDRAGDTIKGPLAVNGNLTVGLPTKGATLRILNKQEDANGGTLTLGTDAATSASLRLGYHGTYSWIQSHVTKPLLINPLGGNVGIGTTNPSQKLSVYDGELVLQTDNNAQDQSIVFQNSGGSYTWRLYRTDAGSSKADLRIAGGLDTDFTALADYVAIDNAGNVGIGTMAPAATLQIGDTINHRAGYDFSPSALVVRSKTPNGGNSPAAAESVLALVREGVASQAYGNMADFRLRRFENNGTNARTELSVFLTEGAFAPQQIMTLRSNGNVGIGTGEPAEMLHLASKGSAKIKIEADTDNSGESDHPQLLFAQDGGQVTGYLGFSGGTNHLRLASTYDNADGMIDFITRNAVRMTIHGDGNVGIGTATPGATLDIKANAPMKDVHSWQEAIRFSNNEHSAITHPGGGLMFGLHKNRSFYFADIKGLKFQKYVLQLDAETGKITSPMWRVTQVLNSKEGGLPKQGTFTSGGGTLLIFASGSGFAPGPQQIGMQIQVDGVVKGTAKRFTNEGESHKTFTTQALVVTGIAAGSYTVKLVSWNGTSTDHNDFFTVTVLELPF